MVVLLLALLSFSQPPLPASGPPVTGTAFVRGHVTSAETGQPIRKATVRISAPDIRENRSVSTDNEGRYEFKDVKAGRYTVSASKGSYVNLAYGQTRPFDAGKPIEIKDGQIVERVDFSLPHGGIITGRILDEFGDPLSDVQVSAMRYQFVH